MALQSITELNSYSFILHFFSLSVFVFVLPHVFVNVFVLPSFTMTSISQSCDTEPIPFEPSAGLLGIVSAMFYLF